jgi:hypothetical protein
MASKSESWKQVSVTSFKNPANQQNETDFKIEEVFERRDDGSTHAPHRYEHAIERSLYYASAPLA